MNLHWPQIIWLTWAALMVVTAIGVHGKQRRPANGFARIVWVLMIYGLLWFGGFFSA